MFYLGKFVFQMFLVVIILIIVDMMIIEVLGGTGIIPLTILRIVITPLRYLDRDRFSFCMELDFHFHSHSGW